MMRDILRRRLRLNLVRDSMGIVKWFEGEGTLTGITRSSVTAAKYKQLFM